MRIIPIVIWGIASAWTSPAVLAQASFALRNYDFQGATVVVDAPVYNPNGDLLDGNSWRAELYGGAQPDSLSPVTVWDLGGDAREIISLAAPGYFVSNETLVVRSVPEADWAWLQMKVWDVTLGSTYEEAVARSLGGYGESLIFYAEGGAPSAPLPTLPGPLIGLESFSVRAVIPEPSTLALLLLGGMVLGWRARPGRTGHKSTTHPVPSR